MQNNIKIIFVLIILLFAILGLGMLISGGHSIFLEGLATGDKQKMLDILNNKRLTNNSKIDAIVKLNVQDKTIQDILNKKTKSGKPITNVQKTVHLLAYLRK